MKTPLEIHRSNHLTTTTKTTESKATTPTKIHGKRKYQKSLTTKPDQRPSGPSRLKGLFSKHINSGAAYAALQQDDVELGIESGEYFERKSKNLLNNNIGSSSDSSSSLEDLFVAPTRTPRRKVRTKIMRKGGSYSMRDTFQSSRQYYQQFKQPLQCTRHQQQHSNHINNSGNVGSWQQQNNMETPLRPDNYYLCQQHATKSPSLYNSISANARGYLTPIDIPPPPPQPTNIGVNNCHPMTNCNNTNIGGGGINCSSTTSTGPGTGTSTSNNNNKCMQLIQQNSLGRQQRQCHCKHTIEYVQQTTAAAPTTTITPSVVTQQQHQQQQQHLTVLQSPHPQRNQHDFYDTHLTPPPPPLAHIPGQQQHQQPQQQQQHQQQQPFKHPYTHTHTHTHQYHTHHRSQDHLQHLLPTKIPSKCSGGSTATVTTGFDIDGPHYKNLVYSQKKIRRRRWILGTVIGIICLAALGVAIYFIARDSGDNGSGDNSNSNGIQLEDILSGQLAAKRFNASWSTGSNLIFKDGNNIVEYDVQSAQRRFLFSDNEQQYVLYEKSADGQLLLLGKKVKKNFRHSYEAEYDIYDINAKKISPLLINGEQRFILMAQWAPVGNGLILNYDRNLYYKPNAFADEIAITNDETPGILNGVPDWVYEEEVFSSNTATWFNPDGTMIAFIRFDDTPTNVINFPYYGEAGDLRYQYPYNRLVAYPKAGSSNPHVKLFTANLTRAAAGLDALTEIPKPSELNTETDDIITVVHWLDKQNILSVWKNRIQNVAYLQVFDGVKRTVIFNIESKTGWVNIFDAPFHNRDGSRIALILPQVQDDDVPYRHLCTISTTGPNGQPEILTKGKYVVQSILYWDPSSDVIFYTANTAQQSEVLHLYSIKATTGQTPKCLTCKLHISGDVEQTYYAATFNADHQVIISSLGPDVPMHVAYEWSYTNNQVTLKKLIDFEDNAQLRTKLKTIAMPSTEIHNIPIDGGFTAKVLLQLPPNLDRSGRTKYPMLVDVYGGPDSYSVINKWILDWGTYLSSNQSVIYAKIDGRGSGLRGDKLLHSVYLKLGTVEIDDQINVAKSLQEKFNFIDTKHTGIWGWSYGGYAAAMALANDNSSVFNCAASIAPVTDWAYYDSIYTERYMSLPKLNEIGYANGRLSTRAEKLRGKKFLLVHGTLDDNVHYQQAMILAKNLERYDILFKQISYPDEDHGLAGVRPHLYHSLDRFFGDCFGSKRLMGIK